MFQLNLPRKDLLLPTKMQWRCKYKQKRHNFIYGFIENSNAMSCHVMPFDLYGSYGILSRERLKSADCHASIYLKMESLSSYSGFPARGNIVSANGINFKNNGTNHHIAMAHHGRWFQTFWCPGRRIMARALHRLLPRLATAPTLSTRQLNTSAARCRCKIVGDDSEMIWFGWIWLWGRETFRVGPKVLDSE